MTDKQLRKLSRIELLEMLIQHSKEITRLQEQLEEAHELLEDKYIAIDKAGSIAEASLQINGVFSAAQQAADQYLQNVSLRQNEGEGDDILQERVPAMEAEQTQEAAPQQEDDVVTDAETPAVEAEAEAENPAVGTEHEAESQQDHAVTAPPANTAEAWSEAAAIIAQAQAQAYEMIAKAQEECDEIDGRAKEESQSWWAETSKKMDAFYKERVGLREMLAEQYSSAAEQE